jgi:uncharacterized membrane protein
MKLTWKSEAVPLSVIAGMLAASAATWSRAPDRLPVHFDMQGNADRYGGKAEALLAMPAMAVLLYLLLTFLPRLDPGRANYDRFVGAFRVIRLASLLLVAGVHVVLLSPVYGVELGGTWVVPFGLGIFFIVLGATMGKLRPNWFFGIRTPWTLSSKRAWVRTHRLGGWLFVASGLLISAVSVIAPHWSLPVLMAATISAAVICIVYSYLVWRTDPDRQPPAGTRPVEDQGG